MSDLVLQLMKNRDNWKKISVALADSLPVSKATKMDNHILVGWRPDGLTNKLN